jgi:hypothetical protein
MNGRYTRQIEFCQKGEKPELTHISFSDINVLPDGWRSKPSPSILLRKVASSDT